MLDQGPDLDQLKSTLEEKLEVYEIKLRHLKEAKSRNSLIEKKLTKVKLIALIVSICCCLQIYINNENRAIALPDFSDFNSDYLTA